MLPYNLLFYDAFKNVLRNYNYFFKRFPNHSLARVIEVYSIYFNVVDLLRNNLITFIMRNVVSFKLHEIIITLL